MRFATPYRQLIADTRPATERRSAPDAPGLRARALAALHQDALDGRLADGEHTAGDRDLTVRAWQITRRAARERLALMLEAVLIDAERSHAGRGAAVPVCREEVEVARDEIVRLAERLRDPRPVRPRGVALARRLLTDGNGPLYRPANDELWRALRQAAVALD